MSPLEFQVFHIENRKSYQVTAYKNLSSSTVFGFCDPDVLIERFEPVYLLEQMAQGLMLEV